MSKNNNKRPKKLTKSNKTINGLTKYNEVEDKGVLVDLSFLYKMTKCIKRAALLTNKQDRKDFFDNFQKMLGDSRNYNNLTEFMNAYGSSNGCKISNDYTKNVINNFRSKFPKDISLIESKNYLLHIHLKKGGKGRWLLHGITYDNIFFILDVDLEHEGV